MDTWKKDRLGSALRGENPTVLAKSPIDGHSFPLPMNSGFLNITYLVVI
jgi:hypothetical protein